VIGLLLLVGSAAALGTALLRRAGWRKPVRVSFFALAWGLGLAVLSGILVALAASGFPIGRFAVVGLCVASLALGVVFGRAPRPLGLPPVKTPLERHGLLAAAVVAILIAISVATMPPTSVDARTLWSFHARVINDTGSYPAPELRDAHFPIPHPQYPPLLPMAEAAAAWAAGGPDDRVLRTVPTLFYLAVAVLLLAELPRRDPRWGVPLALTWILMPTLVLFEEGGADSGVADTPLAFYLLASVVAADSGAPVLAGGFLAAGVLTKNEGIVLGALLLAAAFWRDRNQRRALAAMAVVFVSVLIAWLALRAGIPPGLDENYTSRLSLAALERGLPRAGALAFEMLRIAFAFPQRSGLFWWMVVALWLGSPRRWEALVRGRLWILPAFVGILFVIYLVSPWQGLAQVQFSFSRILLQLAPLALWGLTEPARAPAAEA
jgi:hypothetical protein